MTLSPEERRRIYEEEKTKVETDKGPPQKDESTLDLKPGVAGLLCYLGGWITGIIFLVIEQKNRTVRFHAAQSIIVFGGLNIIYLLFRQIPFAGIVFGTIIGIAAFVLWIVLMVKATQGMFSLPVAGDLAEKILGAPRPSASQPASSASTSAPAQPASAEPPVKTQRHLDSGRAGRIASSAFSIAFAIAVIIFFNFYHDYIAYYHMETVMGVSRWVREPILTSAFSMWLPIVNAVLLLSIAGHIILLAFDRYLLREGTLLVLDLFGIVSIAALLSIFPFDFSVFGNTLDAPLDLLARATLVIIIFGIGIAALVRLIKILVNVIRGTATY